MARETELAYQPFIPQLIPELPSVELPDDPLSACSPSNLAEKISGQLVGLMGSAERELPVNLDVLARNCGVVKVIRKNDGSFSPFGRVVPLCDSYYVVELKEYQSRSEWEHMVTLGHEIGHIVLNKLGLDLSCGIIYKEDFCEAFAQAVLLPKESVLNELKTLKKGPATLKCQKLAEKAQVPIRYVVKRLVEDLKIFEGIFVVIPSPKHDMGGIHERAADWVSVGNFPFPLTGNQIEELFIKGIYLSGVISSSRHLDCSRNHVQIVDHNIGVINPRRPGWTTVYELEIDVAFLNNGDGGGALRNICWIKLGRKLGIVHEDYDSSKNFVTI